MAVLATRKRRYGRDRFQSPDLVARDDGSPFPDFRTLLPGPSQVGFDGWSNSPGAKPRRTVKFPRQSKAKP